MYSERKWEGESNSLKWFIFVWPTPYVSIQITSQSFEIDWSCRARRGRWSALSSTLSLFFWLFLPLGLFLVLSCNCLFSFFSSPVRGPRTLDAQPPLSVIPPSTPPGLLPPCLTLHLFPQHSSLWCAKECQVLTHAASPTWVSSCAPSTSDIQASPSNPSRHTPRIEPTLLSLSLSDNSSSLSFGPTSPGGRPCFHAVSSPS